MDFSQVIHAVGISSSVFLSGFAFSASYYGMPAVNLAPFPLRLKQWKEIFDIGKYFAPTLGVTSALFWGIASRNALMNSGQGKDSNWKIYAIASLSTFGIIPWTLFFMMPTNNELIRRSQAPIAESEKEGFEVESQHLLSNWTALNWVRAVLPLTGAGLGLYAALKK